MISICKAASAIITVVFLLSACSNQSMDRFTASNSSCTTEVTQYSDFNKPEDTENVLPTSIRTNATEITQHSDFIEPDDTEYVVPTTTYTEFEYSNFRDFYEQNKNTEIKGLINSALSQLDPSAWTPFFKYATDDYYSKFYSFVYELKLQMPDIISAEVVSMPEDLECEVYTVDYAVCLIDRDGNRYTVGLADPGNTVFAAFWLNDILLDSYYIIE